MTTANPEITNAADGDLNKRREERFALRVNAILCRPNGETKRGVTVNVSGSGVLMELAPGDQFEVGDEVDCSIELYEGKPPQPWGIGKIVRRENSLVAIEFTGLEWLMADR